MSKNYVIDTNSLISYFHQIFNQPTKLSTKTRNLIEGAFYTSAGEIKLSIPSMVLVEIFEKWLNNAEFQAKFYYEVFSLIKQSPNIEIKPIEPEVLENLLKINGSLIKHDIHDKIILASAMMLNCPLITFDSHIIEYVNANQVIPKTLN